MKEEYIWLSDLKPLENNPRTITDDEFDALKKSLDEDGWMLNFRGIVVDENNVILGGNQRYKALVDMGIDQIPKEWVFQYTDLTDEQKKEFAIKDNTHFGEWDFPEIDKLSPDQKRELQETGLPIWVDEDLDPDGLYSGKFDNEDDEEGEDEDDNEPDNSPKEFKMLQIEFELKDYDAAKDLVSEAKAADHDFTGTLQEILDENKPDESE